MLQNMNELPVWDKDDALKRMGGKVDRLVMLLNLYLQESKNYHQTLTTSFDEHDIAQVALTAHTMAGVVGNLSAKQLHFTCKQLENAALESNVDKVNELWPIFKKQFDLLARVITEALETMTVDRAVTPKANASEQQRIINQLAKALVRNDFIAPGEVTVLFSHLKNKVTDNTAQRLLSQINDMNYNAALDTLRIIAQQMGVKLNV